MPTTRLTKMTEKLFNEGVIKMKTGVVVSVIVTIIISVFGAGIGWEKIQARLRHLDGKTDVYDERVTALTNRVTAVEQKFIELQTNYKNIENLLKDIQIKVSQ